MKLLLGFFVFLFIFSSLDAESFGNDNTAVSREDVVMSTIQRFIDLEAISVTGSNQIIATQQYNYTIRVKNNSTTTQSNYLIKLIANDLGLATVNGPAINPQEILDVVIPWTPLIGGQIQLTGKVIISGDEVSANDVTPSLAVSIEAYGSYCIAIGNGNQTSNAGPVNMSAQNSLFEYLIMQDEIGMSGMFNSLTFFNSFQTHLPNKPTKVWLGMTDAMDLSAGWIPFGNMTQVFDGNVDYPYGQNYINIPFAVPFICTGGNLVVLIQRPMDTASYSPNDVFLSQTIGTNRALSFSSDTVTINPSAPPTGILSGQFPKTIISSIVVCPPMVYVFPSVFNYGIVPVNSHLDKVFNVILLTGGSVSITSISISGSSFFSITNQPNLPIALTAFQPVPFTVRYNPMALGIHSASVILTDNWGNRHDFEISSDQENRNRYTVSLSGTCADPTIYTLPYTQNFDTVTAPAIPVEWRTIANPQGYCRTSTTNPQSSPNCIEMNNVESFTSSIMLISPPIAASIPMYSIKVKFLAKAQMGYTLKLGVMTNPLDESTFTELSTVTLTNAWAQYSVLLSSYTGQGQFIAFKHGLQVSNRIIYIDNVTFEQIPQNDLSALSITGNAAPTLNSLTNYCVVVQNKGYSAQTNYTVTLYKEGGIELGTTAGTLLNPNETAAYEFSWTPTVAGNTYLYGIVQLNGDQNTLNDQTQNCPILVTTNSNSTLSWIGEGNLSSIYAPATFWYRTSLFESIYYSTEMNFIGMLTGVQFINNFQNALNKPIKIWLGTTTQNSLDSGFISASQLTLVYDGIVNLPNGLNVIQIDFTLPFLYLQDNLVMMVQRPFDTHNCDSTEQFLCQVDDVNRAIRAVSDVSMFNPVSPPLGTPTGLFPKTRFMTPSTFLPNITGTVYCINNLPLSNATVSILNGAQSTTNAFGVYHLQNILSGNYEVTANHHGYLPQTVMVNVLADTTTTQDFILSQRPTVIVTGTISGSDIPTLGLAGATIYLTGYENYSATTNAVGQFVITGVYASQTYQYTISAIGYSISTGSITIGNVNYNMGSLIVNEIVYEPTNVQAVFNYPNLTVSWSMPDPNAVTINESFEINEVPPPNWSNAISNYGTANTSGIFPTWCRFGSTNAGAIVINPPDGNWQCGLRWDYNHQDEWLITPPFVCPINAHLSFWTYVFQGSLNGDHYYVKVSNNDGISWDILWDASLLTGGWNIYQTPIVIDLSAYAGQQIKLAWQAKDSSVTNDGLWYNWFIDDVRVNNTQTSINFTEADLTTISAEPAGLKKSQNLSESMTRATDSASQAYGNSFPHFQEIPHNNEINRFPDYKVWRLHPGEEQSEQLWTLLTPNVIEALSFVDNGFVNQPAGSYKWAVKAVYPNNVHSMPAFSNSIVHGNPYLGALVGVVLDINNSPIAGALITTGTFATTTNATGHYTLSLWQGTYAVTCTAQGYQSCTIEGIVINGNGQQTTQDFMMNSTVTDYVQIDRTALIGNYPNPFNPKTTISYNVKGIMPVKIEIFNIRGQLIRTLLDEVKANGHHNVVWDGKDFRGKAVAGGIYHCRMQSKAYQANIRILLLK
jgi:hypothetical protein